MTTLRKTPALSNNGGFKVNDDVYAEEVNANVVALWGRAACWVDSVGGSANHITGSANPPLTGAPTKPMSFWLIPVVNNTANAYLNLDSFGEFEIRDIGANAIGASTLTTGNLYLLVFDGTFYRIMFSTATSGSDPDPDTIFVDQKSVNTNGGTFTLGAWRTRDLQTTVQNEIAGCTLDGSTGQFTLQQGSYFIEWAAPAFNVNGHVSRLFNVTGNTSVAQGEGQYAGGSTVQTPATGRALIAPSTTTTYRIEHQSTNSQSTTGFGNATGIGAFEQYTVVKIWQLGQLPSQINGLPGGANSFFQTFSTTTTNANPGNGTFRLNNATQMSATAIYVNDLDFGLTDITALIQSYDISTASVKGRFKLTKWDDPTKWLIFDVTARITHTGYEEFTLVAIDSSANSPFANNDKILLTYTFAGPKGDTGSTGAPGSTGTVNAANIGLSMINGSLALSAASNALTIAIKQADGVTNPSGGAPVMVPMRNGTVSNGTYQIISLTAATSLVISAGSTMGFTNGIPGRLWIGLTEDGQIFAVNCCDANNNLYPLGQFDIITTLAEGGAGGADNPQQPYSTTAVSNKAYAILGYVTWETALATAGNWVTTGIYIRLYKPGQTPLPGEQVQEQGNITGAVGTTTTSTSNFTDTIPNGGQGIQVLSQAITPTSQGNVLKIDAALHFAMGTNACCIHALFQDNAGAGTSALASTVASGGTNTGVINQAFLRWRMRSNKQGTSTTFSIRGAMNNGTGAYTFNGISTSTREMGGSLASYINVVEVQG